MAFEAISALRMARRWLPGRSLRAQATKRKRNTAGLANPCSKRLSNAVRRMLFECPQQISFDGHSFPLIDRTAR